VVEHHRDHHSVSCLVRLMLIAIAMLWCAVPLSQSVSAVEPVPFFDAAQKPPRPPASELRAIRFLTDDDYPPFHFPGPDGQLTGFNVDLARAICEELRVACTIQARRWDTLSSSLEASQGDAIIASRKATPAERERFSFSIPYYRTPARFVIRKNGGREKEFADPSSDALAGKTVAVVTGTAHAAFLARFYPRTAVQSQPGQADVLRLLLKGEIDAAFGDGISLALWLNGPDGAGCCQFLGEAFFEGDYFGEGAMIAFRKDSAALRRAVNFALYRLAETGEYQQLMRKYFPVSFY
jgi:polar amino acid transport system substrate-binding protein